MTKKHDKKEVEVTIPPSYDIIYGYMEEETIYTPKSIFEKCNIPKEDYYTFKIRPLTDDEKNKIVEIVQLVKLETMQWCRENNINIASFQRGKIPQDYFFYADEEIKEVIEAKYENGFHTTSESVRKELSRFLKAKDRQAFIDAQAKRVLEESMYTQKYKSIGIKNNDFHIIQKCIIGLDNYKNKKGEKVPFSAIENSDYISNKIWESLPPVIKADLRTEILRISNTSDYEIANL